MIVQNEVNEIHRSGITGERKFGISMNAKMYDMMSAKLYQDRIGSVVREVCSNAWDGMKMKSVATGNPIEPFKVTLPTNLEPHFVVEDFGVGMEDEMAQDLYSTLGMSTKENSNDQIGAFGLGSKSPFAVTDTFHVENTYQGVTYYYLCFKNESGLPSLLKTGEKVEDSRPNGVKVIIPAPYSKFNEYVTAINKQLFAMEPKPIITNGRSFEFETPNKVAETEFGYILGNASDFNLLGRSVYGRMGMVIYPIDPSQAGISSQRLYANIPYESAIILNFPIGALDPLPSREGLTYDKRTIANILEQYSKFVAEYKKTLLDEVLACKTPRLAYHKIKNIHNNTSLDMINDGIKINGYEVSDRRIPDFFPKFDYKYEITHPELIKESFTRWNGTVVPREVTPARVEKKTSPEEKFVYEDYSQRDTRLTTVKSLHGFNSDIKYPFLDQLINKKVRILIMDEIDPKYRVARLKSVLNTLASWDVTLRMVFVNPRCDAAVDRVDFSEFLDPLEKIEPGITKHFQKLSDIARPVIEKQSFVKDSKTPIEGIKYVEPSDFTSTYSSSIERYLSLDKMEELVERTAATKHRYPFGDRAFYINCTRNTVDLYETKTIADFCRFASNNGIYFFVARKGGASQIKWLEENGVLEFSKYIETRMKDVQVSEDFRKYNSSRLIAASNQDYMFYGLKSDCLDSLYKLLSKRGEYIHPMLINRHEIQRLSKMNMNIQAGGDTQLLVSLKDSGLMTMFDGTHEWAGKLDFDMTTQWKADLDKFDEDYPLANIVFENRSFIKEVGGINNNSRGVEYISDYSKIRGFAVPTVTDFPIGEDAVEVVESVSPIAVTEEVQINVEIDNQ